MKKLFAATAIGVALVVTACGSSGGSAQPAPSTGATSNAAVGASSSAPTGTGATKLTPGTIGVLEINGQSEQIAHWATTVTDAMKTVGWKTVVVDGKGDPSVLAQGLTSLTSQKVDGVITLAVDAALIAPQLSAAKAAGIPVIASGITVSDPNHLYAGAFAPSDAQFGTVLAAYLKTKFPSGTQYIQIDIPAVSGAHALIVQADPILAQDGFKLAGSQNIPPSDIVNQTTQATSNLIQAHPQAKFLLSCCDFMPPISVPALKAAGHPDVVVVSRYDDLATLAVIRAGGATITAAANSDTAILESADAILAAHASKTPIPTSNPQSAYQYTVIDKSNLPPAGQYFYQPSTQIATFSTKWAKEYSE